MQSERFEQIAELIGYGRDEDRCPCGCGAETGYNRVTGASKFRPGHDARLVSNLRKAMRVNSGVGDLTGSEATEFLNVCGHERLANKLRRDMLHVPANAPTMKAARKLLRDLRWDPKAPDALDTRFAERWVPRVCTQYSAHCQHDDLVGCARTLVLNDCTASKVRQIAS